MHDFTDFEQRLILFCGIGSLLISIVLFLQVVDIGKKIDQLPHEPQPKVEQQRERIVPRRERSQLSRASYREPAAVCPKCWSPLAATCLAGENGDDPNKSRCPSCGWEEPIRRTK
jgi:hypothetical protein